MKIRTGFVSNSSSSSFVINEYDEKMKLFIIDHINIHSQLYSTSKEPYYNSWWIKFKDGKISLYTSMNNFCIYSFHKDVENKELKDFNITRGLEYLTEENILNLISEEESVSPSIEEEIYEKIKKDGFYFRIDKDENTNDNDVDVLVGDSVYILYEIKNFLQKSLIARRREKLKKIK